MIQCFETLHCRKVHSWKAQCFLWHQDHQVHTGSPRHSGDSVLNKIMAVHIPRRCRKGWKMASLHLAPCLTYWWYTEMTWCGSMIRCFAGGRYCYLCFERWAWRCRFSQHDDLISCSASCCAWWPNDGATLIGATIWIKLCPTRWAWDGADAATAI